jgi:glutamine synthetase
VGKIPEILLDNTDRNRTSPFAFTGNKFEFRAVGSNANCAKPMTVLNAMVAERLNQFKIETDALIDKKGMKKDDAIFNVLRDQIKGIKSILFEGDGYSGEWEKLSKKRGLSNNRTTPEALPAFVSKKSITLFESLEILNERELEARYHVDLEEYVMKLQIEARTLGDISRNHIIPTGIRYQNTLIENVKGLKEIYGKDYQKHAKEQMAIIERISQHIAAINTGVNAMIEARKKANILEDIHQKATAYCKEVFPFFHEIRYQCDKLELIVDASIWPLAKYRQLLFMQ